MGGNLAWTLRLSDGTEHRMDRWTNSLPQDILNPAFLDETPQGIVAAMSSWSMMKADWEANRHTGNYTHPMTERYAPYPYGLRPSEYGLVVTCFKTRKILSLQSYTDLARITETRLWTGPDCDQSFPGRRAQAEALRETGRITSYEFILLKKGAADAFVEAGHQVTAHPHGDAWIAIAKGDCDYKALADLCDRLRAQDSFPDRNVLQVMAWLDLAPFTLQAFPETSAGLRALHSEVLAMGFELSSSEQEAWESRIARMAEQED